MATVTRYLGTCPVCEGTFKLQVTTETRTGRPMKATMVHHGYKRPGIGEIIGDCFGVGYPPYEMSTEGTKAYLSVVVAGIDSNRDELRRLDGDPPLLVEKNPHRGRHERPEFKELTTADGWTYKDAKMRRVRRIDYAVAELERDQRRCEALISNWTPQPVRTEEEDVRLKAQLAAPARAAREEARQQRQAKRDATIAKQEAREQRERQFVAHYHDAFLIPDLTTARAAAIWIKMHREAKKQVSSSGRFLMSFVKAMGVDDRLMELGLAKPSSYRRGGVDYATEDGWLRP